jgi:hypothetical protein
LAVLMAMLIGVISGFIWLTVSRIRRDSRDSQAPSAMASNANELEVEVIAYMSSIPLVPRREVPASNV